MFILVHLLSVGIFDIWFQWDSNDYINPKTLHEDYINPRTLDNNYSKPRTLDNDFLNSRTMHNNHFNSRTQDKDYIYTEPWIMIIFIQEPWIMIILILEPWMMTMKTWMGLNMMILWEDHCSVGLKMVHLVMVPSQRLLITGNVFLSGQGKVKNSVDLWNFLCLT